MSTAGGQLGVRASDCPTLTHPAGDTILVRSPVFENVMYHEFNLEKVQKRLLILHATQHPDAVPYVTLYSGDSSTSQPYFEFNDGSISTWQKASFITIKELL